MRLLKPRRTAVWCVTGTASCKEYGWLFSEPDIIPGHQINLVEHIFVADDGTTYYYMHRSSATALHNNIDKFVPRRTWAFWERLPDWSDCIPDIEIRTKQTYLSVCPLSLMKSVR